MTPMIEQYKEIKAKHQDAMLFFRLGDFYEMFYEDALEGSRLLQITLTSRGRSDEKIPMCGIPYHAAQNYIAKLTKFGRKVALCEQLSDPNEPGIVKRDVVRVVTPGTTLDENILEQKNNNYLVAISFKKEGTTSETRFGLAVCDISTGEFKVTEIQSGKNLQTEIERICPSEAIVKPKLLQNFQTHLKATEAKIFFFGHDFELNPTDFLKDFFKIQNLEAFGLNELPAATEAAALLLHYLQTTQKTDLAHIQGLQTYALSEFMPLDEATLKNLELLSTLRENKKEGSLLWVLDQTVTSMGGRKLRFMLTHPLTDLVKIQARLDSVQELFENSRILDDLREILKEVLDLERLLGRLSLGQGSARDLKGLQISLQKIPYLQSILLSLQSAHLKEILGEMDALPDLAVLIEKSIVDEPPLAVKEGGMIKEGFHAELDELKKISREGKGFIQALQQQEIKRTGINSLKVRFNQVFGYYIEISKANLNAVPQDYIRKQTLVNAERFITPELKEYEEKVLGAEEKIMALEYQIFTELREKVVSEIRRIQKLAQALANLDALCSFAKVALENGYCKPTINESKSINIQGGRHPVVEKMNFSGRFVENDTILDQEKQQILLITGPNMGGKSTYLRQVALIVLMAQIGSFVPAAHAEIGLVDRIFTRVGASDNLVRGQSTFMVEMQETAHILQNATSKSLIILDEIGRGTSTYDGMSIAWSILEFLHDYLQAKTLFATHYHELIALAEKLPHAQNYSVAVKEDEQDGVTFLYKILPGGVDRSYGIEVAKLAGLPQTVIGRAKQILSDLEEGKNLEESRKQVSREQLAIFEEDRVPQSLQPNPELEHLKKLDLNNLTPLQALQKLHEVQSKLKK
jgi:DNA mismatch repair protein MutS